MSLDSSRVLNQHKNKLIEVSRKSKIPLSILETEENDPFTFTIKVKGTNLKFVVMQQESYFHYLTYIYSELRPNFPMSGIKPYTNITEVCAAYGFWLDDVVKKYMELAETPDEWAEMQIVQSMISSKAFTQEDLEMFTESEKRQIQDSLKEFERLIKEEINPIKENLESIQQKLDYLSAAVNKLNRFDWKGVALSTVIGIATNLSVDANTGKQVFDLFQQAFSSVIRLLPK